MASATDIANKALAHHRAGQIGEAITLYRQVLKNHPQNVSVLSNLAMALESQRQHAEAARTALTALKVDPDHLDARRTLAKALRNSGDHHAAVQAWRDAIARRPNASEPRMELARTLTILRRIDEAIEAWREVAATDPANVESRVEAARLLLRLGRNDEAASLLAEAIRLRPEDGEANVLTASMERRAGHEDAARLRLERVVQTGDALAVGRASLELANLLEKRGNFDRAFIVAERGQAALRSRLSPRAADLAPAMMVIAACRREITPEVVATWKSPPADSLRDPVFVVGFPRAGTTLIEQMLAGHPALVVTDELPLLQTVKDAMVDRLKMRQQYPASLSALGERQLAILRETYHEAARRWLGEAARVGGRRIVDKAPLNTVDLCLVRRLFPAAQVIVALRDPRDIVLSCFFQAFTEGLPHLFGFESAAQLYAAMMDLWLHYRASLGLRWMELRYEDVVAQPEARAREMIEFIGEEWNDAVLQFHGSERRRYVTTPSFDDVSKPVYATSMRRWERYRPQFERVRAMLEPFVREFGYDGW